MHGMRCITLSRGQPRVLRYVERTQTWWDFIPGGIADSERNYTWSDIRPGGISYLEGYHTWRDIIPGGRSQRA